MTTRIFVGNLPFTAHTEDIENCFRQFGAVASVRLDVDPDTGRSRRRCLVEMEDEDEAQFAIDTLNGRDFQGRALVVNELNSARSASSRRRSCVYRRPDPAATALPLHLFAK